MFETSILGTITLRSPINEAALASIPHRRSQKGIVVLKFGGTTVGATKEQQRIRLARDTIASLIDQGKSVVAVFSAFRRGRSGAAEKTSVTDILENHKRYVAQESSFEAGVQHVYDRLRKAHFGLIEDLQLSDVESLSEDVLREIKALRTMVRMSCSAYENSPSLNDLIITAGERLAVKILSAYFNEQLREGKFPQQTVPLTAMELGIYTDNQFGSANIDWLRAIDHSREVIVGQYLERNLVPIVTGFDGIYDPSDGFKEIMRTAQDQQTDLDQRYADVYRTSLGRGGSDLTATFLGLALDAEYVGFCKETRGVLTADDMLVGEAAKTVPELNYDLATEAGNIYAKAVEPVRHGNVPVHIFDPAQPGSRTIISDVELPEGLFILERPIEAVNINTRTIRNEPGSLLDFLKMFADRGLNVEEIRHQRSGTDCIVCGKEDEITALVSDLNARGLQSQAHYTWYLRVIGNVTEDLSATFNEFMRQFGALTLSTFQIGTKVVTSTVPRNRAGDQKRETKRIEGIVQKIHDELVVGVCQPGEVRSTSQFVEANS